MPQKPIDDIYQALIAEVTTQHPAQATIAEVRRAIKSRVETDESLDIDKEPSDKTIDRYIKQVREQQAASPFAYKHHQPYVWPNHHEDGTLPWSSAMYGILLKRHTDKLYFPVVTVRMVEWAHYVAMSAPDCPLEPNPKMPLTSIVEIAHSMAASERAGFTNYPSHIPTYFEEGRAVDAYTVNEVVQEMLIRRPWESLKAYKEWTTNPIAVDSPVGFFEYSQRGRMRPALNPSKAQTRAMATGMEMLMPTRLIRNDMKVTVFGVKKEEK